MLCRWKCEVMPLEALGSHGIELQVNVLYSCLCCKFQEWRSYEYNGGLFSSMLTWKKSSAMLFNCVHSSARQLSKPYCKHSLRFIQISTIMKLMLFTLNFKWQLFFLFIYLYWNTVRDIMPGWPFCFTEWWVSPLKSWSSIISIWCHFPGQTTNLSPFAALSGEHTHHSLINGNNRLIKMKAHIQQTCCWIF